MCLQKILKDWCSSNVQTSQKNKIKLLLVQNKAQGGSHRGNENNSNAFTKKIFTDFVLCFAFLLFFVCFVAVVVFVCWRCS